MKRLVIPIQKVQRPVQITFFKNRKQPFLNQKLPQRFQIHQTGFPRAVTRIGHAASIPRSMVHQYFVHEADSLRGSQRGMHEKAVVGGMQVLEPQSRLQNKLPAKQLIPCPAVPQIKDHIRYFFR